MDNKRREELKAQLRAELRSRRKPRTAEDRRKQRIRNYMKDPLGTIAESSQEFGGYCVVPPTLSSNKYDDPKPTISYEAIIDSGIILLLVAFAIFFRGRIMILGRKLYAQIRKLAMCMNRPHKEKNTMEGFCKILKPIVKFLLTLIVLIGCYLFLLNNRYSHVGGYLYFDKWAKKIIVVESEYKKSK